MMITVQEFQKAYQALEPYICRAEEQAKTGLSTSSKVEEVASQAFEQVKDMARNEKNELVELALLNIQHKFTSKPSLIQEDLIAYQRDELGDYKEERYWSDLCFYLK